MEKCQLHYGCVIKFLLKLHHTVATSPLPPHMQLLKLSFWDAKIAGRKANQRRPKVNSSLSSLLGDCNQDWELGSSLNWGRASELKSYPGIRHEIIESAGLLGGSQYFLFSCAGKLLQGPPAPHPTPTPHNVVSVLMGAVPKAVLYIFHFLPRSKKASVHMPNSWCIGLFVCLASDRCRESLRLQLPLKNNAFVFFVSVVKSWPVTQTVQIFVNKFYAVLTRGSDLVHRLHPEWQLSKSCFENPWEPLFCFLSFLLVLLAPKMKVAVFSSSAELEWPSVGLIYFLPWKIHGAWTELGRLLMH